MIVVLDTNILVSGLLRPHSKPAAILRLITTGALRVAYDQRILAEYRDVLGRPAFPFSAEQARALVEQLEADGIAVAAGPLKDRLPDPDDEPFLETALAARADVLVTGNTRHYPTRARQGVLVLDPAAFLEHWTRRRRS